MDFKETITEISKTLNGSDPEFFKRVWDADLNKYKTRLEILKMFGHKKILDAGFGMGQWLVKLAEMNENVYGIEYSKDRVQAVEKILHSKNITNTQIQQGSIEALPYSDNEFDAIFCYGVIFCTDYRKSLKEFTRVLKPGGKLYFTANDLGWFLFCLIEEHNKSENYNPRKMAIDTISGSVDYYCGLPFVPGNQLIIKKNVIKEELEELGFNNIIVKPEGHINFINANEQHSFYKHTNYLNEGFIFEVHATKK